MPPNELPTIPSLPSPGSLLAPVTNLAGEIGSGIGSAGKGAAALADKVIHLTGAGGVAGKIEESVGKIREFANEQVDALVNGAVAAAKATADFADQTLNSAIHQSSEAVAKALEEAKDLVKEIEAVPAQASALLEDAEQIKQTALERRDALHKHAKRFRERRKQIPKVVGQHFQELSIELEDELDQDAAEAERVGDKVVKDSQQLYDKTVADAKHYGTILLKQTEQNLNRGKQLKKELAGGSVAAKTWASDQVKKVAAFKSERTKAAQSIGDPAEAKKFAQESIEGAHRVASDIQRDASAKPAEIASFGQTRVNEAMELAKNIRLEIDTAKAWTLSQKGNNAQWKRAMRENRSTAESFLKSQESRVQMKIVQHGKAVGQAGEDLAADQLQDSARTLGKSVQDVKKTFGDVQGRMSGDEKEVGEDLRRQKIGDLPEAEKPSRNDFKLGMVLPIDDSDLSEGPPLIQEEKPAATQAKPKELALDSKPKPKTPEKAKAKEIGTQGKQQVPSEQKKPSTDGVQTVATIGAVQPKEQPAPEGTPKTTGAGTPAKGPTVEAKVAKPPVAAAVLPSLPKPEEKKEKPEPPKKEQSGPKPDTLTPANTAVPALGDKKAEKSAVGGSVKAESAAKPAAAGQPAKTTPATSSTPKTSSTSKTPANPLTEAKAKTPNSGIPGAGPGVSQPKKDNSSAIAGAANAVQKKASTPTQPEDPKQFHAHLQSMSGPGETPNANVRQELSKHVGFDPKMARFHTGPVAAAAAHSLGADAFTIGQHVYFAQGKFDPTTPKGMGLIAHETTHIGQQLGLKGNKLQFHTKAGGDAMEQEAQDVGERVQANLAYGTTLKVGRYVRSYTPDGDDPLNTSVQQRLDRISMSALRIAGRKLNQIPRQKPIRLDEVTVDISLNLEELSDQEAADIWAEAIVAAIESTRATDIDSLDTREVAQPVTHLLQKRLGNEADKPAEKKGPEMDPKTKAAYAKIAVTAQEKDMIRKLLARKEVDPMIETAKAKTRINPSSVGPAGGYVPPGPHNVVLDADKPPIEAKLKEFDIASLEEFEKLKVDFIAAFNAKGVAVTNFVLDQNLQIVLKEKSRYLSRDKDNPDASINTLREAAKRILDAMPPIQKQFNKLISILQRHPGSFSPAIGFPSTTATSDNLDSFYDTYQEKLASKEIVVRPKTTKTFLGLPVENMEQYPTEEDLAGIDQAWADFDKVRKAEGNKHVVLLGRNFDPKKITDTKDAGELELTMFHHIEDIEKNIRYAQERVTPEKFWELSPMIDMTKGQMGVRPGEGADKTVTEAKQGKADDNMLWNVLQAAAAIALAVTAMVATGGLAAVALIGSAGLSVYGAAKHASEYAFQEAAGQSSLDQAKLISKDDPSLFWLALDLVAAGMDVAAAVGAFKTLANIAKSAAMSSDAKAIRKLEEAAREQYKTMKGMKLSEDQFVERLLEAAKKGTAGAENASKQIKMIAELIEATSPRAVAILKGDKAAIQSLVMEHGNWKGLMGALTTGGEDAQKMAKNISGFREELIADLKARGAAPLEDASSEMVSDYDLNVKSTPEKGAGQRVLDFEEELAKRFNKPFDDVSQALNLNFYTDKSQLLTVDQALKMVGPERRAAILKKVTDQAEKLNFAKMLEHAGNRAEAIREVEEMMKTAKVDYSIDELRKMGEKLHETGRADTMKSVDGLVKKMNELPPGDPGRVQLAEDITMKQMEANFLSKESYIGPAAVKGGRVSNLEVYQQALSQMTEMSEAIHGAGGDIVRACREYEFYKYVNRYVAAAKKAGVESHGLDYFEGLSAYVYKRARTAQQETGAFPGLINADEAAGHATDQFIIDTYNQFRKEANETLPKIKEAAERADGAKGWQPEMKDPKPNSGPMEPRGPKQGDAPPNSSGPPTKPTPTPDGKGPGLPSAAATHQEAAKKAVAGKGTKVPDGALDGSKKLSSAGFGGSGQGSGVGVFKTNIPGVDHEVVVKMYPIDMQAKMESEMAAAMAGEKAGGPKVYGKVTGKAGEGAPERVGFAMDEVKGGFADDYAGADDIAKETANKAEMMKHAANIKPETFTDLNNFREAFFEQGFYYRGELQGFVDSNGHWKAIDFQGAEPISTAESIEKARAIHDANFDGVRDQLMANAIDAKKAAAKK